MTSRETRAARLARTGARIEGIGALVARIGLALVIGWIGGLKFLAYEAEGIRGLVENSPLLSWMYAVWGVRGVSNVIGGIEVSAAVLILLRPLAPRAAALGSLLAVGMFATTLSFLFTTPGVVQPGHGFPALSGAGGFLLKDVVLLGVAVWSLGDSLAHAARRAGADDALRRGDA
jgi:uncharacterized membrane protein YkgB